ncbi:TPA: hypothetical protein ACXD4G_002834 [Staphylococcus aureus]
MNYTITELSLRNPNYLGISRELFINDKYCNLSFLAKILYSILSKLQFRNGYDEWTLNMRKLESESKLVAEDIEPYLIDLEELDLIFTAGDKIVVLQQRELAKKGIYKMPSFLLKDAFDDLDWYAKILYTIYRNRYLFAIKENMGNSDFYNDEHILYGIYKIKDIVNELMIDEETVEMYNEQLIHAHLLNTSTTTNGYLRFYTYDVSSVPKQSNTKTTHHEKQKLIKYMPSKIAFIFQTMDIEHILKIQHAMRSYIAHYNINNPNRYLRKHADGISKIIQTMALVGDTDNKDVYTKHNLCFYVFNNEMKRYLDNPNHFKTNKSQINYHIDIFNSMMSTILSDLKINKNDSFKIKRLQNTFPEFQKSTISLLRLFTFNDAIFLGNTLRDIIEINNISNIDLTPDNLFSYSDNMSSINIAICEVKGLLILADLEFSHIAPFLNDMLFDRFNTYYDWTTTDIGIDIEKQYAELEKGNNSYSFSEETSYMVQLLIQLTNCNESEENTQAIQRVLYLFSGFHRSILPLKLEKYMLSLKLSDFIYVFRMFSLGIADYTLSMKYKMNLFHVDLSLLEDRLLRCIDIILHVKNSTKLNDNTNICISIVSGEISKSYQDGHQYEYVKHTETEITNLINEYLEEEKQ